VRAGHILKVSEHGVLQTPLVEFHQIYNLGAAWNKDEMVIFSGQKVKRSKVKVTARPTMVK